MLPGERPVIYLTRDRAEVLVCELCKPRAEAAGWMLPAEAEARRAEGGGRERRRPRGQMLGGLLARRPSAASEGEELDDADRGEPQRAPRPARSRRPAEERVSASERVAASERVDQPSITPQAPAANNSPGTTLPEALAAFNASDHRRTVRGLTRTLGPPRASGLAIRAKGGYPGARLTVAWELTWYQWEVAPGERGPEVRESGKGETLDQLRAADRTWNLMVDSDGTLEQRAASKPTPAEPDEQPPR